MNYKEATTILGLPEVWNNDMLKKAYRKSALRYHPDKNNSSDASTQFDLVKRAFEYLLKNEENNRNRNNMTSEENMNNGEINKKYNFDNFSNFDNFDNFDNNVHELASLFDKIKPFDPDKLQQLFGACKNVVGITKDIMKDAIKKNKKEEIKYEIEVTLQQMLDDNVYILKHKDKSLLVPLWFDEIYFEENDEIINVSIIPQLPANVKLNSNNHLVVSILKDNLQSFDIGKYQSNNVDKINLNLHMSNISSGSKFTLWNVGLLKMNDETSNSNDKINTSEREGVTFIVK
jgi:hypothetical protein